MSENKSITRSLLKEIIIEQKVNLKQKNPGIIRHQLKNLEAKLHTNQIIIITGIRRCGKSTLLIQLGKKLGFEKINFVNFEDERFISFTAQDFNLLLEVLYEVNSQNEYYFFDEIQVIPNWEIFIRRLHDSGKKIVITGSNASLLSQELGTHLTGRHLDLELFPFSFLEFLGFHNLQIKKDDLFITSKRAQVIKLFFEYTTRGGMPSYLINDDKEIISGIYNDIIYRDICKRYKIDNIKGFRELSLYLLSNITSSLSYNKLKNYFNFGSPNTIAKYISYLENCYLFFIVNPFFPSFRKQINAPKKIYSICNSFPDKIGFHVGLNQGVFLENLVYTHLRRLNKNIFYYQTTNQLEVDFLIINEESKPVLVQVTNSLQNPKVYERETRALLKAAEELNCNELYIFTESEKSTVNINSKTLTVIPVYEWLVTGLANRND